MAEWSKATVLKTVVGFSYRGFESLFIRFDRLSIRANRRVESNSQLSVFYYIENLEMTAKRFSRNSLLTSALF